MGRHKDTGHALNIIFPEQIEQGRTDRRTLVNSILQVEDLTSTPKVQSMTHALQEIHFVVGKFTFLLQDQVEAVAIDRIIGGFIVCENAKFILMFLDLFGSLCKQENVYACNHTCHKTSTKKKLI
jgi:hypothetical protein